MDTLILLAETSLPPWVDELVLLAIKIFGAALVALAALAIRKLGKKWGMEETVHAEIRGRMLAQDAINFAERWARNLDKETGDRAESKDKLEAALDFAIDIDKSLGLTTKARMVFKRKVEAELEKLEGNGNGQT